VRRWITEERHTLPARNEEKELSAPRNQIMKKNVEKKFTKKTKYLTTAKALLNKAKTIAERRPRKTGKRTYTEISERDL